MEKPTNEQPPQDTPDDEKNLSAFQLKERR